MFVGLPDHCYVNLPSTGEVIAIKREESGYYPIQSRATADELNQAIGVTKAQVKAMLVGSMLGWDVPGANPEMYE
ncbi:hypothetical protein [Sporomusa aerivorans]|uniref:hypothetical protein n=1 Tax=Sporomusa aerivorans TaxID=204936 RepID=UPI00352B6EBD